MACSTADCMISCLLPSRYQSPIDWLSCTSQVPREKIRPNILGVRIGKTLISSPSSFPLITTESKSNHQSNNARTNSY
ncbi:predicted protein [Sclerotinia sclerotiorum 1980 UF-70]|uniref:Uncharacterized protein n=1 Tax=Sclerotinia sclerotiorum (strain ATCC 18683 / 1980 / Ss-1) TaxID=665079 RepID=A7F2T1_SCLS1|nr:predicted protein [Sclerotinia sclerotiorum 1980 UF-70]EDN96023.1 predicted protein [Sclerotinia sclerotiorum 1980 UF-70]